MYIGKLGDGSSPDDGIYILIKEAIDNSIDEFVMGHGNVVEITLDEDTMEVRDFGRGIPLGKLMDCAAKINTGAKYDSEAFKKSVGLNGVGIKAVNALSSFFEIQAFRDGMTRAIEFSEGAVTAEMKRSHRTTEKDGTRLMFTPDRTVFSEKFAFRHDVIERMLRYYSYLNPGLTLNFNGKKFKSKNGLSDLLEEELDEEPLYPIIKLVGEDIEVAFTHAAHYGEEYYSFVNGQHTTQGGTHQAAFRESIVKTVREHFKKTFEPADIRQGIVAAISVKVIEPVFESQTKTKLGSTHVAPEEQGGESMRSFVGSFLQTELDNFLHRNKGTGKALMERIQQSERERKELKGIRKLARERSKKAKVHNKKLRDCRVHFSSNHKSKEKSTLFITEGDSASGSITKVRDVETQAVFSLRGKPLNSYGLTRKVVYENEEFNLLQAALGIEDSVEELHYNRVVIATDADVDGMHIRLLLLTFFLQFFPDLVKRGHLYILKTPLFRVRNKKKAFYCYTEKERFDAVSACGKAAEITRFKGLGEISPDEFRGFIGKDMRVERVGLDGNSHLKELLAFYMGKNTPERQAFIIKNLRIEADIVDGDEAAGVGQSEFDGQGELALA
ncbi:MAG: toprim domain-containing protein [Verrucomicrobiales bacterium]|nr:toprim domain-containing protein [Verrucomicrobiales bacterium]